MTKLRSATLTAFTGLLFLSSGYLTRAANAKPTTLKLGVFYPMSGPTSSFGEESMAGAKLAISEINASSKDIKIEFTLEDDKSDVTEAANAVKKLINVDKVNVVLGSVASSNTNAGAPIAQAAKIPLVTSASTNVNVTQKGEYISRTCFIDDFQGAALAKFAVETLKAKKAAIVTDSASDYSQGLAKSFRDSFKKLGGEIVVEVSYVATDNDFSSQITKMRTRKPDVVFAPGYYNNVGIMMKQAKTLGLKSVFLGGDGWSSPKLFELAGDAVVGHYFSDHFSSEDSDPMVQDFVKRFKTANKVEPGAMAALGYDAVYVIADAMKRAGYKTDPVSLMKAINSTKNLKGVTGSITLDRDRNASKPLVILETQKTHASFKQRVSP